MGNFMMANSTLVSMVSRDYNMHLAFCILTLELQYKSLLMATPLVHGIEDLHLILHFLEGSSWLTLPLPPDAFHYKQNIHEDWVVDGWNVSDTEHCVECVGDAFLEVYILLQGPRYYILLRRISNYSIVAIDKDQILNGGKGQSFISKKIFRLGGMAPSEWTRSVRAVRDTLVAESSWPGIDTSRRVV